MKTLAAILVEQNQPLQLWELEIPQLKPGQVLVKIHCTGLCHTQLGEIQGKKGPDSYMPHTLGHEGAGEVVECGAEVTKVKVDDRVVITWLKGKGRDVSGTVYTSQGKNINSGAVSTFMEYAVVSENRLVPIAKSFDYKIASLLGCAVPTGAGIVFNDLKAKANSSFIIFGLGGVGLSSLLAAKSLQPSLLIAVDQQPVKLELAKKFGATHVLQATDPNFTHQIKEITQGKGVDYAIEAVGLTKVMEQAFSSVKDFGGTCVIAGNPSKGEKLNLDPYDFIKGKRLIGSWGGGSQIDEDVVTYIKLMQAGQLDLATLISHEYTLAEINEAFKMLESGQASRVILNI